MLIVNTEKKTKYKKCYFVLGEINAMKSMKKEDKLQDDYIGQKTAEVLAIDYDENQLLAATFSSPIRKQRREALSDVK